MKAHPFFRDIDWDALYSKEIPAPFIPQIREDSDVSNVDPEFLAEVPQETPYEQSQLAGMANEDGDFDNFTYANPNQMSVIERQTATRPQTELLNLRSSFALHDSIDRTFDQQDQSSLSAAQQDAT